MQTIESITALIERSDQAVKRAIKVLAPVGFDGPDAVFLADIYAKLPHYDDRMTPSQYRRARKALPAYAERLLEIANARMGEIVQEPMHERERAFDAEDHWGMW